MLFGAAPSIVSIRSFRRMGRGLVHSRPVHHLLEAPRFTRWRGNRTKRSRTSLKHGLGTPKHFEYGDILFAITGERVEDIAKSSTYVGHEKCLAGGDIVVLKHEQTPKYLMMITPRSLKQKYLYVTLLKIAIIPFAQSEASWDQ